MQIGKGVPSVWPGYVAAVASLVLSLLLLLAILVFAMTQVQNLVGRHKESITRAVLEQEISHRQEAVATPETATTPAQPKAVARPSAPAARSVAQAPEPTAPAPKADSARASRKGALHLRFIFEAGASDLPQAQRADMLAAIQQQNLSGQAGVWDLTVQTPASDLVFERSAYRLMLQVRNALAEQGVPTKAIRMQLQRTQTPPVGYEKGEILIHARAHESATTEKGTP